MRLSRALSDLVKYTKSVRVHDIETQGKYCSCSFFYTHSIAEMELNVFFGSLFQQLASFLAQ